MATSTPAEHHSLCTEQFVNKFRDVRGQQQSSLAVASLGTDRIMQMRCRAGAAASLMLGGVLAGL